MPLQPILLLQPTSPSALLSHITTYHAYPTTLVLASYASRQNFVAALEDDVIQSPVEPAVHPLLRSTLRQASVARHIRTLATPTISHLRALLATFPGCDSETRSRIPPPPPQPQGRDDWDARSERCPACGAGRAEPLLVVYGLVEAHRGTSEWSAQGIGSTVAAVVDACAEESGFRALLVESGRRPRIDRGTGTGTDTGEGDADGADEEHEGLVEQGDWWEEKVPLLSGKFQGRWSSRGIEVRRILGRWVEIAPETHAVIGEHGEHGQVRSDLASSQGSVQQYSQQ